MTERENNPSRTDADGHESSDSEQSGNEDDHRDSDPTASESDSRTDERRHESVGDTQDTAKQGDGSMTRSEDTDEEESPTDSTRGTPQNPAESIPKHTGESVKRFVGLLEEKNWFRDQASQKFSARVDGPPTPDREAASRLLDLWRESSGVDPRDRRIDELEAKAREQKERISELESELEKERERATRVEEQLEQKREEVDTYLQNKQEEFEEKKHNATVDLVAELLADVWEPLQRALDTETDVDIRDGVRVTRDEFQRVLKERDIEVIHPNNGEELDRDEHSVLRTVDTEEVESGSVVQVEEPGVRVDGSVEEKAKVFAAD